MFYYIHVKLFYDIFYDVHVVYMCSGMVFYDALYNIHVAYIYVIMQCSTIYACI
jgi:hypothetical protein